jgi:ER membrane protein complex subunit 4
MSVNAKWRVNMRASGKTSASLPSPPGLMMKVVADTELDSVNLELLAEKENAVKQQQAMKMAYAPGTALFQTALMLWMSGSSIQIFSIYSTFNALSSPVKGLFNLETVFGRFAKDKGVDTNMPKLIYIVLQLVALGVGMYKCHTMGLLPVTSIDWLWQLPDKIHTEEAGIPL